MNPSRNVSDLTRPLVDPEHPTQHAHSEPGPFPPAGGGLPPGIPSRIESFHLLEVIGRGGMGVVFRAEQDEPRRIVALKLVRPGLAEPDVIRRFRAEAEVLGRLQHPGIAQIYEVGTVDAGGGPQPFLAMEYISGKPLSTYATENKLDVPSRLKLFMQVCVAVQHAHTKAVIHRDLKPANILVTEDGQPKVLDFGLARVIGGADAAAISLHTVAGQILGTVPYMSPEQVGGPGAELDTRSDVYALGVILYELLTGRLPYEFRTGAFPDSLRVIREVEPTPLRNANAALPLDLDLITRHALEKDRDRRYQSAADFASDIQRFLRDEPILARPPSFGYRFRKFARRRRALVLGAGAVILAMLGGFVATSLALARALRAESRAEAALADALAARSAEEAQRKEAERERAVAKSEAETAQKINELVNEMLAAASPEQGARDITVREVIDRAAARMPESLSGRPLVEAGIRSTIGATYLGLGLFEPARTQLERALQLRREHPGSNLVAALNDRSALATVLQNTGQLDEAEQMFRAVIEESDAALGPSSSPSLANRNNLAIVIANRGRMAESEEIFRDLLKQTTVALGPDDRQTLDAMLNLASVLHSVGKLDEAESFSRACVDARRRVLGPEHPTTLTAISNLAVLLASREKREEALPLYVESLELARKVLGPEHPDTLTYLANLAGLTRDLGRREEGTRLYREALELRMRALGPHNSDTVDSQRDLAFALEDLGQLEEAESLLRAAYRTTTDHLDPQTPNANSVTYALGRILVARGKHAEAEPLPRTAAERAEQIFGPETWRIGVYRAMLGEALRELGRTTEAESMLQDAHARMTAKLGPTHSHTRRAARALARLYRASGQDENADRWQALGDDAPPTASAPSRPNGSAASAPAAQ